jgi:hypothetical protein
MKPIVIIGIVVGIGLAVLGIIVANQQMEINDMKRQEILESRVVECGMIIAKANPFNNELEQAKINRDQCMDKVMAEYGNQAQKDAWEIMKNVDIREQSSQEVPESFREMKEALEEYRIELGNNQGESIEFCDNEGMCGYYFIDKTEPFCIQQGICYSPRK